MEAEQTHGPIMVPIGVADQLEAVRETGRTNMADINGVQQVASDMNLYKLVIWCEESRGSGKLGMGCLVGFMDEDE